MRLDSGDRIVGMEVCRHGQTLFAATEYGFGKRTSIDEYPVQQRGGKGVITIKTSERNGRVVALLLVKENEDLMLMTNSGKLIRMPVARPLALRAMIVVPTARNEPGEVHNHTLGPPKRCLCRRG